MVKVCYFAYSRERIGKREEEIELPSNVSLVSEFRKYLCSLYPEASDMIDSIQLAINCTYITHDQEAHTCLCNNDTVALLPQVSGG